MSLVYTKNDPLFILFSHFTFMFYKSGFHCRFELTVLKINYNKFVEIESVFQYIFKMFVERVKHVFHIMRHIYFQKVNSP